jgi:ADP-heptose:LPS heptosyltransferase
VACEPLGAPIAQACSAVDEVILLRKGWNRWLDIYLQAARLQNFDIVIAVKGGFDLRLALLSRLTNAPQRIGFAPEKTMPSIFFTDSVAMPEDSHQEHQIETQLRLLAPLGIHQAPPDLSFIVPEEANIQARKILAESPFPADTSLVLVNLSCNRPVKFYAEDYARLIRALLTKKMAFGLVGTRADRPVLDALVLSIGSTQVAVMETRGILDLAALLQQARLFITPEGGAAHLSSATRTPTLVLWSGDYGKWRPRGMRHVLVGANDDEKIIPIERLLEAIHKHHLLD